MLFHFCVSYVSVRWSCESCLPLKPPGSPSITKLCPFVVLMLMSAGLVPAQLPIWLPGLSMMLNSHFDVGFVSSSPLDASVIGQMVPSIEERSFLTVQCNMRFTFTFLPVCAPLQFACRGGCGCCKDTACEKHREDDTFGRHGEGCVSWDAAVLWLCCV